VVDGHRPADRPGPRTLASVPRPVEAADQLDLFA